MAKHVCNAASFLSYQRHMTYLNCSQKYSYFDYFRKSFSFCLFVKDLFLFSTSTADLKAAGLILWKALPWFSALNSETLSRLDLFGHKYSRLFDNILRDSSWHLWQVCRRLFFRSWQFWSSANVNWYGGVIVRRAWQYDRIISVLQILLVTKAISTNWSFSQIPRKRQTPKIDNLYPPSVRQIFFY